MIMARKPQQGISLIETIIVIVLIAVLSSIIALLMIVPLKTYHDSQHRGELIQLGEVVLQRFSQEVKYALPRSIRVDSTGQYIEFLHTTHAGHYRAITKGSEQALSFTAASQTFHTLFPIQSNTIEVGAGSQACQQAQANCLIIYHPNLFASHAYQGNLATISHSETNSGKTSISFDNSDLSGWHFIQPFTTFPHPLQLFYITDTPITYACTADLLMRYTGYEITAVQPTSLPINKGKRLINNINSCQFSLIPSNKGDIIKLSLQITHPKTQHTIDLVQQILVPYPS